MKYLVLFLLLLCSCTNEIECPDGSVVEIKYNPDYSLRYKYEVKVQYINYIDQYNHITYRYYYFHTDKNYKIGDTIRIQKL